MIHPKINFASRLMRFSSKGTSSISTENSVATWARPLLRRVKLGWRNPTSNFTRSSKCYTFAQYQHVIFYFCLKTIILLKLLHPPTTCRETLSLWSAITTTIVFNGSVCQVRRNTAHNSGYSDFSFSKHVQNKTFISQAYAVP